MNLTDLSELMHERADHDPTPVLADSRISGIGRKVAVARRRRAVGVLAGLVLIVVAAGLPLMNVLPAKHASPAQTPPTIRKIDGWDEYTNGGHLEAHQARQLGTGSITLTANANDLGFFVTSVCPSTDADVEIDMAISMNGRNDGRVTCSSGGGAYAEYSPANYSTWNVTHGQPITFVFTPEAFKLTPNDDNVTIDQTPTTLPGGSFSVAVYERVPFTSYPLPQRPKKLAELHPEEFDLPDDGDLTKVMSEPGNPLASKTFTLTLPAECDPGTLVGCLSVVLTSQTPGQLDLRINGVLIESAMFWDYNAGGAAIEIENKMQSQEAPYGSVQLTPGQSVTVTLIPHYMTGAWEFAAGPRTQ